jgi:GTP-binding protein
VKIHSAEFVKSATAPAHYPPPRLPEIAFAGRSNVGKSALINCLAQKKGLAKTSNTPGRTRLINFYLVNGAWSFVDLPGYGYARVAEAMRREWRPMVESYLLGRESLRLVLLVLDVRRDPGEHDLNFFDWLRQRGIPVMLVITKADKLSRAAALARRRQIESRCGLPAGVEGVLFSAVTAQGRIDILKAIQQLAR